MEFSSAQATLRIRRVQLFCAENGLDGVLLVPGVDGRFSVCNQAMGYLFSGRSNRDTIDVVKLDDNLDDAVALVTATEVRLYIPDAELREQLQGLLVPHVASLRILGPTVSEAADPDLLEENKLASFVHMLRGCQRLGIPCSLSPCPAQKNEEPPSSQLAPRLGAEQLLALERWPLLQAYGLEGVHDVQPYMQHLYGQLDGRSLEVLVSESVPTLRLHWDEMLQAGAGWRSSCPPESCAGPAAQMTRLAPALHWVVEGADPRSALRVARSYFLTRGCGTRDVFADPEEREEEEAEQGFMFASAIAAWEGQAGEVVMMMRMYAAVVEAAHAAMSHFALVDGATALSAKAVAVEVLARRAEQLGLAGSPTAARLRFTLMQMDHMNRVTVPAVRGSRQLKVIRLSLPDISPRNSGGKLLGGLVYGDTFLELPPTPPYTTASAASTVASGWRLLVLTEGIPAMVAIPGGGGVEEVLEGRALRSLMRVVEEGGTGGGGGRLRTSQARTSSLSSRRELERRAAGAAAEAEALAGKLRARKGAGGPEPGEELEGEVEEEEEAEEEPAAAASSSPATAAAAKLRPADALGRLLTLGGGGDDAVLLTGAPVCPALYGTLYCFSGGLVFVEAISRALWVLDLRGGGAAVAGGGVAPAAAAGVEAVTIQQLPLPQRAVAAAAAALSLSAADGAGDSASGGGGGVRVGLGEAVVFRGSSPACGLPPACHVTANTHVALPLEAMSPAARRFLIQSVLPAWQQTCREAAAAAAAAGPLPGPPSPASYLKDMTAPNPFPPALHRAHAYAIQVSSMVGGGSGGGDGGRGVAAGPRVALLPPDEGPLGEKHFAAALAAAAAADGAAVAAAPRHLVIATSSYTGLSEQLRMLAAAAVGGAAGRWRLAAVVVCVSGDVSYEEPGRGVLAGGLLAQMLPGFVDCVVLGGSDAAKVSQGTRCTEMKISSLGSVVSELSELVASRLPEVPLVRSSRTALLRARQELLPPPAERAVRLASQRAAADRAAWAPLAAAATAAAAVGGSCSGGLFGQLRATRVVVEGSLDVTKLKCVLNDARARLFVALLIAFARTVLPYCRRAAVAGLGAPQDPAWAPRLPLLDEDNNNNHNNQHNQLNHHQQHDAAAGKQPVRAAASPAVPVASVASDGPGSVCGQQLVCVSGCLRLSDGGALMEVVGTRQLALRSREWPLAEAAIVLGAPVLPYDGRSPGGELLFVGSGAAVEPQRVKALLASCGVGGDSNGNGGNGSAAAAPAAVPASAGELTSSQRTAIRAARLWDPLPEGYCFNGTQYFDAFGDASLEHPHMDRFIAEWISEQQQQADRSQRGGTEAGRSAGGAPRVMIRSQRMDPAQNPPFIQTMKLH
ncbi:cilia/flagella specific MOT9 [Volvox carteri f. nagariensis]|uniref:Cilia/flagella specific MOT9 n=1 Tax=Volvox carteri f. nagariensis TaxID=3068 RepID=D8UHC6_VOLCA|nr:cilia/flagella specific MOT9 [Volvox carteri f. nagariensis]EFJ40882.1 cilia/flagella specific MOT9 [Volvox carteri f. nagariensis]|eukprot:XP_002958042.1 cilia/flagella specific MOT9 [Volvox carteri f. nagariensis]